MIQKNNNVAIGGFVIGAVILLFLVLLFFSGGNYFTDKERVVMYFDGSVQGLQIGAPVKLKGVELGEVVDIEVTFLSDNVTIINAVTADIILQRINRKTAQSGGDIFEGVIERGLRAQLNYQSLLTGLLYIELDFYPDSELRMFDLQSDYREFPTTKTDIESLFNELESIDLIAMSNKLGSIMTSLDKLLKSGKIETAASDFSMAAQAIQKTAATIEGMSTVLSSDVEVLIKSLTITANNFNTLALESNALLPDVKQDVALTLAELRKAINNLNLRISTVGDTFSEDSRLVNQLTQSAEEVERAAQAIRLLSETLEQQPESLLRGKQGVQ